VSRAIRTLARLWSLAGLVPVLALGSVLSAAAVARDYRAGTIMISDPWARATTSKNGAAYLTLRNVGQTADRLVSLHSPLCARVELHSQRVENGVVRMQRLGAVTIGPSAGLVLKPGATHAMLLGLQRQLRPGDEFPLTLVFDKAGRIEVTVRIEAPGATPGAADPNTRQHDDHG